MFYTYEVTSVETIDNGMWFYLKDTKFSLMMVLTPKHVKETQ